MTSSYTLAGDDGELIDARFTVDGSDLILHSRGGARGKRAVNSDYSSAMLRLVQRLAAQGIRIRGAWVDSETVQSMPLEARRILTEKEGLGPPEQVCATMALRMKSVRAEPNSAARGGNSTKRIRIGTDFAGEERLLAARVGGVPLTGDYRSQDRLPVEVLRKVTAEDIWTAVQELVAGGTEHRFGPSTDFDLIAEGDVRLPPKAVFGLALSRALGGAEIGPEHFSAGESSTCFRLLRQAGFQVVPKGAVVAVSATDTDHEFDSDDREWAEGREYLASHKKRERATGLAAAKRAQFRRLHGSLTCERCGMDPVAEFKTPHGEACIEVHHAAVHIGAMTPEHKTTLDDLQCLCANCHRLVHRLLRVGLEPS